MGVLLVRVEAAFAVKSHGIFTFGGYVSKETFSATPLLDGSSNDFATLSARYLLRLDDMGEKKWNAVFDVRDKHDFFDLLDRERLNLTDKNDFQVRQLSAYLANPEGFWGGQAGRFPLPQAGSVYVDGAAVDMHWTKGLRTFVFAGYNPKKESQAYLQFDAKAITHGLGLSYQQYGGGWAKNFFLASSLVSKYYEEHLDRKYFFQNVVYQWNEKSRIIGIGYLDFVPRTYVQTGNIIWQQSVSPSLHFELGALGMDVIEYSRRQGVLETISPSPYRQTSQRLSYRLTPSSDVVINARQGKREVDALTLTEATLGLSTREAFGPNWDSYVAVGSRENFVSSDNLFKAGFGFYSKTWEWNFDIDYQIQKNLDTTITHPVIAQISTAHFFSRKTYGTLSLEFARDEKVTIYSAFFRIGYRFGNREIPPVRDGAPPRGAL